ncbi:MAG: histidine kinase [Acetobacteraceae bacterium]|nr:MAG: histidine kinase [Acetobacteraceae bacterium]
MTKMNPLRTLWPADALQRAVDAAGLSIWLWNVESNEFQMDERGCRMWDVPADMPVAFEHLSEKIHPADRDRVRAAFLATRAVVGPYEIDFRTLIDGHVFWISARGLGSDEGIVDGGMMGVFLDVTGRKQAQESSELLAGEMSHRVKNLLSVASVLARVTSRSSADVGDMTEQLIGRLSALGRAHDLARPLSAHEGDTTLLADIFAVVLAPYDDQGAFAGRIRIAIPRLGVGPGASVSLALVVHELATNSVKYGAFSVPDGMLDVSGENHGEYLEIAWSEQGGPPANHHAGAGYGSKLVRQTIEQGLRGSIDYTWSDSGLVIRMRLKTETLGV